MTPSLSDFARRIPPFHVMALHRHNLALSFLQFLPVGEHTQELVSFYHSQTLQHYSCLEHRIWLVGKFLDAILKEYKTDLEEKAH